MHPTSEEKGDSCVDSCVYSCVYSCQSDACLLPLACCRAALRYQAAARMPLIPPCLDASGCTLSCMGLARDWGPLAGVLAVRGCRLAEAGTIGAMGDGFACGLQGPVGLSGTCLRYLSSSAGFRWD